MFHDCIIVKWLSVNLCCTTWIYCTNMKLNCCQYLIFSILFLICNNGDVMFQSVHLYLLRICIFNWPTRDLHVSITLKLSRNTLMFLCMILYRSQSVLCKTCNISIQIIFVRLLSLITKSVYRLFIWSKGMRIVLCAWHTGWLCVISCNEALVWKIPSSATNQTLIWCLISREDWTKLLDNYFRTSTEADESNNLDVLSVRVLIETDMVVRGYVHAHY